jgi:ribonuclease P protein component
MISRDHRFHGHNALRQVYQKGGTVRGQACTLKYLAPTTRPRYRAAVVVSRKVSKSAPQRNRIRRRIYEIIRLSAPQFRSSCDLVFTVYSEQLAAMPAEQLRELVQGQLMKADILPHQVH